MEGCSISNLHSPNGVFGVDETQFSSELNQKYPLYEVEEMLKNLDRNEDGMLDLLEYALHD